MHPLLDSIMNLYVVGVILPFDSLLTLFGCVFLRKSLGGARLLTFVKSSIDMFRDLWVSAVSGE